MSWEVVLTRDCSAGLTNILEMLNPTTNTWTTKASMPTARAGMATGVAANTTHKNGNSSVHPPFYKFRASWHY